MAARGTIYLLLPVHRFNINVTAPSRYNNVVAGVVIHMDVLHRSFAGIETRDHVRDACMPGHTSPDA